MYSLDQHDQRILRGRTEMVMACCFNPPVTGKEVHGPDGAYALEVENVALAETGSDPLKQPFEEEMTPSNDPYPSRTAPHPRWLPRLDPVVYSSLEQPDGPLSRHQLEDYRRDGFLFFDRTS